MQIGAVLKRAEQRFRAFDFIHRFFASGLQSCGVAATSQNDFEARPHGEASEANETLRVWSFGRW
jgi:hypothetical protein